MHLVSQIKLVWQAHPLQLETLHQQAYLFSFLLKGDAIKWFCPLVNFNSPVLKDFDELIKKFCLRFQESNFCETASQKVLRIYKKSTESVSHCVTRFRVTVDEAVWQEELPRRTIFINGLRSVVRRIFSGFQYQDKDLESTFRVAICAGERNEEQISSNSRDREGRVFTV